LRRIALVALELVMLAANLVGGPMPSLRVVVVVLAAVVAVLLVFLAVVLVLGMAAGRAAGR
jgi:hypothetical protein